MHQPDFHFAFVFHIHDPARLTQELILDQLMGRAGDLTLPF